MNVNIRKMVSHKIKLPPSISILSNGRKENRASTNRSIEHCVTRIEYGWYPSTTICICSCLDWKKPSVQDRVWRAVNANLSDQYKPKSVHVWSGVSSCSDMVAVTDGFLDKTAHRTLFNIKCYDGKVIKDYSAFPRESETILPPGFRFCVKSLSNPAPKLHIIDVEQISLEEPTQGATSTLVVSVAAYSVCLIWLDASADKSKENVATQKQLQKANALFETFEDAQVCENFMRLGNKDSRLVLIVGGHIGRQIVPKIHDLPQIAGIFIYCMDKDANEKWARTQKKVTMPDNIVFHQEMFLSPYFRSKPLLLNQRSLYHKSRRKSLHT